MEYFSTISPINQAIMLGAMAILFGGASNHADTYCTLAPKSIAELAASLNLKFAIEASREQ